MDDENRNDGSKPEAVVAALTDASATAKEAWSTPVLTRLNVSQTEVGPKVKFDLDTFSS